MSKEGVSNNPERVEKQRLLALLREKGIDDPDVLELVNQWYREQEALAEEEGTARARILFHMELVDVYIAYGDLDGALESVNHVLYQAQQEGELELFDKAAD